MENNKEDLLSFGGIPKLSDRLGSSDTSKNKNMFMSSDEPKYQEKLAEELNERLKFGKNLLIQSYSSMSLKYGLKTAAKKVGLSLVWFESENSEDSIKVELDKTNGNAILIPAFMGSKDVYIKVAKERNIPIITLAYNKATDLQIDSFDSPELMISKIDTLPLPQVIMPNGLGLNMSAVEKLRVDSVSSPKDKTTYKNKS